ncbi:MAG TPA: helix-turn-helix domain-containing protein [Solirubrobacteraceae bacterium]|nr:helix-turn-helix domain-containing protein [Solirubrobacteraceae bacterium]
MTLCHVLREDPDLAEAIPPALRPRAVDQCVARTVHVRTGRWSGIGPAVVGTGIGLLVLDGLLLRRVGVEGRFGAELLGEGDLLRPWQGEDATPTLTRTTGWRVLTPVRLALLDDTVARRFADYPELTGRLVARALERARHLSVSMAIIHQARVNVRLHMMLWHLADRWGRVRSEGVFLPLTLTHSVLADLVAARRPTVTSALTELARRDLVRPFPGGWLLLGEPPGELLAVQEVGVAEG